MRRDEILGLRWEHIDLGKKTVFLPMTKNGLSRWVSLSDEAVTMLSKAPKDRDATFPVTEVASRQAWDRLRTRANITDLTFHDLRHETISRMFDHGMMMKYGSGGVTRTPGTRIMIKLLQLFFIIFNNLQAQKSGVLKSV